jgi:hypothetical protein
MKNKNPIALIENKNLIEIKQYLFPITKKIFLLWFISACAYEPKTMVKTPRAVQTKIPLNIKTTNSLESKLNVRLPNKMTPIEKRVPPIVDINFSNFKRNLIGLNKFEIIELLDKPAFKRKEHPASIWQYQSSICFVDIFFFSNKKNMVVDHVETRSKNIRKADEKQCYTSLLNAEYDKKN